MLIPINDRIFVNCKHIEVVQLKSDDGLYANVFVGGEVYRSNRNPFDLVKEIKEAMSSKEYKEDISEQWETFDRK